MTDINKAHVIGVNGNMVTARFQGMVRMNAVAYILLRSPGKETLRLKSEVIRIHGQTCDMQVFEDTRGIRVGDEVELTQDMLSLELGPGILSMVMDGLGNPLEELAQKTGVFLQRGTYIQTLNRTRMWPFTPVARRGDTLCAGNALGTVPEKGFEHRICVPFHLLGEWEVISLAEAGEFTVAQAIAQLRPVDGGPTLDVSMIQNWPIKRPIRAYAERLLPTRPLTTRVRIIDTFFPVADGGTACIPGPFGAGKTVLQQALARYGEADVVVVAACGERAGEVVETLQEFPQLVDPRTGNSLMDRTVIVCNTSSMPVATREASVYTGVTIAEYYRQMGLRTLLLADSTSRWAQALREMSGRLEEIPGEEAFPAYLASVIAAFYERGGQVRLADPNLGESRGSVTVIGTVSPAGGNFEEPVTQSTLALVGCFLGLTYDRSYAKRFPAISPLQSWSKYLSAMAAELEKSYGKDWVPQVQELLNYYREGQDIGDQMKVIGEEELPLDRFVHFLKSELIDAAYLQQNAFSEVDAKPSQERVARSFQMVRRVVAHPFPFADKQEARERLLALTACLRNWNLAAEESEAYADFLRSFEEALADPKQEVHS